MNIWRPISGRMARNLFVPDSSTDCPDSSPLEADGELQTTALEIEDGKIAAIYVVRNPDKLRHLH